MVRTVALLLVFAMIASSLAAPSYYRHRPSVKGNGGKAQATTTISTPVAVRDPMAKLHAAFKTFPTIQGGIGNGGMGGHYNSAGGSGGNFHFGRNRK